jgi:hypothetical protein
MTFGGKTSRSLGFKATLMGSGALMRVNFRPPLERYPKKKFAPSSQFPGWKTSSGTFDLIFSGHKAAFLITAYLPRSSYSWFDTNIPEDFLGEKKKRWELVHVLDWHTNGKA